MAPTRGSSTPCSGATISLERQCDPRTIAFAPSIAADEPVKLLNTAMKGRGIFATRDIVAGEIIMTDQAFCKTFRDVIYDHCRGAPVPTPKVKLLGSPTDIQELETHLKLLWRALQGACLENVEKLRQLKQKGLELPNFVATFVSNMAPVKTGVGKPRVGVLGPWISMINHACFPNGNLST